MRLLLILTSIKQIQLFSQFNDLKMSKAKGSHLDSVAKEQIEFKRQLINRIKANHHQRLLQSKKELDLSPQEQQQAHTSTLTQPQLKSLHKKVEDFDKNKGVSDTQKMFFQKKFKNYLNHRQQYIQLARKRCTSSTVAKKEKHPNIDIGEAEYYNEEEILSQNGSEYQYRDASDMLAAYQQMTTGKIRKTGQTQLYHFTLYQNQFRNIEFQSLTPQQPVEGEPQISKEQFWDYLFNQPIVMMLYSINPYKLADQLAQFETKNNGFLNYLEFSKFLLTDRQPTYVQYTRENLKQAREIGRGLRCAPIKGKWIDESGILQLLIQTYQDIDMRGDGRVDRVFLAKKLRKQAETRRLTEVQVVEIININKLVSLNRLLYEIQFQEREGEQTWSFQEFKTFLTDYKRRKTPEKDRLITKLIMAGKYDPSYIYIISEEVLQIVKDVFSKTPQFAQYFVVKEKFLQNLCNDPRYNKIKNMWVRSQTNRYVKKQTLQDTLVRILAEGDPYLDIEEVLDFLTNRGRPIVVEYRIYLANLQTQFGNIQQEQRRRIQEYGQNQSGSSDDEVNQAINKKRIQRKLEKLKQIRNSNNFDINKKFNVTIPLPFEFDLRDKVKKVSIREQKLKQMLDQKQRQFREGMKPIKCKQVPDYVKQNLYAKMLKDQERERKERLERFRLEIMSQVNVSDRLMRPKSDELHCDFSSPDYKFTARPMPWYCEVNLIDRINRKKQERREKILEEIITKNTDYDLPEGVLRMMNRETQRNQRRAEKARTASTGSVGQCTFVPKISTAIPDFKTIHQHLHFDLENAKNAKQPIKVEPFSFENRPGKSKTTYQPRPLKQRPQNTRHSKYEKVQHGQNYEKIPKTQKFAALVDYRRKQQQLKERQLEEQKRGEAVRKLRQSKFAPVVWRALKHNNVIDQSKSRAIIAEKMKEFKRQQKKKRQEYQNQMIRILTKVYERPLLLQSRAVQSQSKGKSPQKSVEESNIVKSKVKKEQRKDKKGYLQEEIYKKGRADDLKLNLGRHRPLHNLDDDKRREAVQEHQLGNYPPEGDQQDFEEDQEDFQEMYEEEYEQGNLHTS